MWSPYIQSGYRHLNQPWSYYAGSIFRLHNETINVWTHLVALFIYIYITIHYGHQFGYWNYRSTWGILGFGIACILSTLFSSVAHLFHSQSPSAHYTFFQVDYAGVGLYSQYSALLFYTCSGTPLFYKTVDPYYVYINNILGIMMCVLPNYAHVSQNGSLVKKHIMVTLIGIIHTLFIVAPVSFQIYECLQGGPHCHNYNAGNHISCLVSISITVFWFVSNWPQRFYPRRFDLFGQGHQIFHVTLVLTSMLQLRAAVADWKAMDPLLKNWLDDHIQFYHIFGSMLTTLSVDFILIYLMKNNVQQMCDEQLKSNVNHELDAHKTAQKTYAFCNEVPLRCH